MSDLPQYEQLKEFIGKRVPLWQERMNLLHYEIESIFAPICSSDEEEVPADISALWNYMRATITWYLPTLVTMSVKEVDDVIVHELSHIILSPLEGIPKKFHEHMELVVETFCRAIKAGWREKDELLV